MGVIFWFSKMFLKILKPLVKLGFIDSADIEEFIKGLLGGDETEDPSEETPAIDD